MQAREQAGGAPAAGEAAAGPAADGSGGTAALGGQALLDPLQAAFAGDDVVAEFERDKAEAARESTDAVEDPTSLPGWGSWAKAGRDPECASSAAHAVVLPAVLQSGV